MESISDEIKRLPYLDEILPIVNKEAQSKNLDVFIFSEDDLKNDFQFKYKDLAVITVSKNRDNAVWNVRNFKHSYLVKNTKKDNTSIIV
jgi:hypothetical protein